MLIRFCSSLFLANFFQLSLSDNYSFFDIKSSVIYNLISLQFIKHLNMLFILGLEYFCHKILDIFLIDWALLLNVSGDYLARIVYDLF